MSKKFLILMIAWISISSLKASEFKSYMGLNVGYGYLVAEENQLDKQGFNVGTKFVGSWKFENYFLDGSIGYQMEFLKADHISIQNNSPFSELSFRRKMGDVSLGPMVQAQAGVYSTKPTTDEDSEVISNIGLQMVYETYEHKPRYEISILNSFGSNYMKDRELTAIRIGIQFPFGSEEKKTVNKPHMVSIRNFPTLIVPGFLTKSKYIEQKTSFGFKRKSHKLDKRSRFKIEKLAHFLMIHNVKIKTIEITGHADELGTKKYNKSLSLRRAQVVKDIFVKYNIETKFVIISSGRGYSEPIIELENRYSIKNRRTEIKLIDVQISEELKTQLSNIINKKKE